MDLTRTLQIVYFEEKTTEVRQGDKSSRYAIYAYEDKIEGLYENDPAFAQLPYCLSLFEKLSTLPSSEFEAFLDYQIERLENPIIWLEQLIQLLESNGSNFLEKEHPYFISKIEEKQRKLRSKATELVENVVSTWHQVTYNIDYVRHKLQRMESHNEQLLFLMEQLYAYLQDKPSFIIENQVPFDQQINLEIERIKQLKKIKETELKEKVDTNSTPDIKIDTTLSVPELAYLFRILTEFGLIQVDNKTDLFKFIATNFTTKKAGEVSWKSLKNNFDAPPLRAIETWCENFERMYQTAKRQIGH